MSGFQFGFLKSVKTILDTYLDKIVSNISCNKKKQIGQLI